MLKIVFCLFFLVSVHASNFGTEGMGTPKQLTTDPFDPDDVLKDNSSPSSESRTRKISLFSGFVPIVGKTHYSSGTASEFTNNINDLISLGFAKLDSAFKPTTFLSRCILANTYYYATFPIYVVNLITRYNWAIASRIAATGLQPGFVDFGIGSEKTINHGDSIWGIWSAPFRTWSQDSFGRALSVARYTPLALTDKKHLYPLSKESKELLEEDRLEEAKVSPDEAKGLSETEYRSIRESQLKIFKPEWRLQVIAAGFNDISDQSREIQWKADSSRADYLDSAHYLLSRISLPFLGIATALKKDPVEPTKYSCDLSQIELLYKDLNLDISTSKIAILSGLSMFLSASFYKTFKHNHWGYYNDGSNEYSSYFWHGLRLPDVVTYLNPKGVSYHVSTGYQFSDTWSMPVTIEFLVAGGSGIEGSIGLQKRFFSFYNLTLCPLFLIGKDGKGGSLKASIELLDRFFVSGSVAFKDAKTLEGARHILSFEKGSTDIEFSVSAGIMY